MATVCRSNCTQISGHSPWNEPPNPWAKREERTSVWINKPKTLPGPSNRWLLITLPFEEPETIGSWGVLVVMFIPSIWRVSCWTANRASGLCTSVGALHEQIQSGLRVQGMFEPKDLFGHLDGTAKRYSKGSEPYTPLGVLGSWKTYENIWKHIWVWLHKKYSKPLKPQFSFICPLGLFRYPALSRHSQG